MAVYVTLIRWTDKGREGVKTLPDRIDAVTKRVQEAGGKVLFNLVTMGRFDQIAVTEAPDDETVARLALMIAERGNAVTETLRGFKAEEVRKLIS